MVKAKPVQAAHPTPLTGDFGRHHLAGIKTFGHGSKFGSGELIEQDTAFLAQQMGLFSHHGTDEQPIIGLEAKSQDRAGLASFGVAPEHEVPVDWCDALDRVISKRLDQTSLWKPRHADRAHRARTHQHQIGIEQPVNRDARIKEAITEPQLHEHQNARKADASQGNEQPHRLATEKQPSQGDTARLPERPTHGCRRAINRNPVRLLTRAASSGSRATRTSITRASVSAVGSVLNTPRC